MAIGLALPTGALSQSATVSATPSTFTAGGDEITITYTIQPGSFYITSITGTSQITGAPVSCPTGPMNTNSPFTCTSVYTVDAMNDMSGQFAEFATFTGDRIGGSFNITSPTLQVSKSGGGPVTLSVNSSPRPTQPGENITVSATVGSMGCNTGLMPPGSLVVTFGTDSRTLPLVAEFPYSNSGTVSFTTTAPAGSYPVSASYAGGSGCAAGSASAQNHVVEPRPSVSVSANPAVGNSVSFGLTFSAPVTGLTLSDLQITSTAGPTSAALSGSAASYTLTLTGMTQEGTLSVTVPAGSAQTTAGSLNTSGAGNTTYTPPNQQPTAHAGADRTVASAAAVTLDGTGSSDPDAGQTLSYAWTQTAGDPVSLTGATTATPAFTAPTLVAGDADLTLTFSLVVTDNLGLASAADTVTITVAAPDNRQPTAHAGADRTVASAAAVTLDGTGSSDPDAGQTLSYAWTQTAGDPVSLTGATTATPAFTAPTLVAGDADLTLTFSLVVTDNLGLASAADTVTISVMSATTVSITGAPATISGLEPFSVYVTFSRPTPAFDPFAGDMIVTNAVVSGVSGGPSQYSVTITPTGTGDVGLRTPPMPGDEDTPPVAGSNMVFIGSTIVEDTQRAIAEFTLRRANSLVSNQPDLIRFLDGSGCGHFTGHGDDDGGMISGCISHGNIWSDVSGSWGEGYQYVLATVGAHHRISANFLVGGMVQVDRAEDSAARISGTGWMVGPYFAARHPSHPLFLEGRLLYGQTANRISPLGTFTDSFATRRWLAQLKAQGQYERGGVMLMPLLDVSYLSEAQRRYTDTLGNIIPSQTISLLQASAGLDFRAPLRVDSGNLALTGGISAIHSSVTGGSADYEGWRGRINLGLDFQTSNGETLRLGTFYDGVGSAHREVGANLYIGIRF